MPEPLARILIVEDDLDILTFIETELSCEGYEVYTATDGHQGLTTTRTLNPDLIILDRILPGMDGIAFCLRQSSQIPILMLTVRGESQEKVAGLDTGANDYLVKPFDLSESSSGFASLQH
jgi:DNA-binding response OmpR family regulator